MRSAEQIGRTVGEWRDLQRAERERIARELRAELRAADAAGAEWYAWIEAGCPPLTREEYARRDGLYARRGRRAPRDSSSESGLGNRSDTRRGTQRYAERASRAEDQLAIA